jgi:protein TonB
VSAANLQFKLDHRKRFDLAVCAAVAFHLMLLAAAPRYVPRPFTVEEPGPEIVDTPPLFETKPPPDEIPRPKVPATPVPDDDVPESETIPETELDLGDLPPAPPPPLVRPAVAIFVEEMPTKVYAPEPVYPDLARKAEIEGTVTIEIVVSETGEVLDAWVARSVTPLLDQAALAAIRQWRFTPGKNNGIAVRCQVAVPVRFRLR